MDLQSVIRMRAGWNKRSLTLAVGVVTAVAATVLVAAPASAAPASSAGCSTVTLWYDYSDSQITNCPGNGATSWAWVWAPVAGNYFTGVLDHAELRITFADGGSTELDAQAGQSSTASYWEPGQTITQIQLCEQETIGGDFSYRICSQTYAV